MSGQVTALRALALVAVLAVLLIGFGLPAASTVAAPLPQATTSATATTTPSDTEVDPDDEPTDDGSDPTPDQTGTWLALGGALALSVLAGLAVALRKR